MAAPVMATALGIARQLLPDNLGGAQGLGCLVATGALVYFGALVPLNWLVLVTAFQLVRRGLVRRTLSVQPASVRHGEAA